MRSVTLFTCVLLLAVPALSRERGGNTGGAIWPRLSVSPGAVSAGADSQLVACITNAREEVRHGLATGDKLALTFAGGVLLDCSLTASATGFGTAPDWSCDVAGSTATLTYGGPGRTWAGGDLLCATLTWRAPAEPTTLRFDALPVIAGSMSPGEPAFLPIAVGGGGSSRGGVGARVSVVSTGLTPTRAEYGQPPLVIEGLDVTVDAAEGSNLVVSADASAFRCSSTTAHLVGVLQLLLDDTVVHERVMNAEGAGLSTFSADEWAGTVSFAWLSDPLPAGPHRIQLAMRMHEMYAPCIPCYTACVGHRTDPKLQARMSVIELTAP
jgi:hypothetical protein